MRLTGTEGAKHKQSELLLEDNRLLPELFGRHDEHLTQIERLLDVRLHYRGNRLDITGPAQTREIAERAIEALYDRLERGLDVTPGEVDAAVRMAAAGDGASGNAGVIIQTRRRTIVPRSPVQQAYIEALDHHELVFALGPAGTGKTYLAVAKAVSLLLRGDVDRIILSRPAVEAGERLGYLPGDVHEKIDPYLRPLYDALYDMLPGDQVTNRMANGEIEIAPLGFMRGRTLSDAFIILDEAQNTSQMQMKMALTRLGEGSRMTVTGDMSQIDLPPAMKSGLVDCIEILKGVKGVKLVHFTEADVVRHSLVTRIVEAYNKRDEACRQDRKDRPK